MNTSLKDTVEKRVFNKLSESEYKKLDARQRFFYDQEQSEFRQESEFPAVQKRKIHVEEIKQGHEKLGPREQFLTDLETFETTGTVKGSPKSKPKDDEMTDLEVLEHITDPGIRLKFKARHGML